MFRLHHIPSFDGTKLAIHEGGQEGGNGLPVLLLHGLFSSAEVNWIRFGTAQKIVEAGHRLFLPDLRGHGESEHPSDKAFWPPDVLVRDTLHIVRALGLGADLVIGGYSLGARTVVQLLGGQHAGELQPKGAIVAGMGLTGATSATGIRSDMFVAAMERHLAGQKPQPGTPTFQAQAFMERNVKEPAALRHLLDDLDRDVEVALDRITAPVLVTAGEDDRDNGSPPALANALPDGRYRGFPGNHMTGPTAPGLAAAILDFLATL